MSRRNHDTTTRLRFTAVSPPADPAWAWAPYEPNPKQPWTLALAGHLYRRAAFGARWDELQQALADGPKGTVTRLVTPPDETESFNRTYDGYDAGARHGESAEAVRSWWLHRMLRTPYPLGEKMVLFWHGYFGVSNSRVKNAACMINHLHMLRSHALGPFDALLTHVVHDPALLRDLNATSHRKALPCDEFARALLRSYTVGVGAYTEADVRAVARSFTGMFVLRDRVSFRAREHDDGDKTVLGKRGPWRARDILAMLHGHRATSVRVVRRLYRFLISETEEPTESLLAPLVDQFARDRRVAGVVETMLRSNLFFSPAAYRQRVKSPVDYALGIVRPLEGMVGTAQLGTDLAGLGQNLCHAPTTRGWVGGTRWIETGTIMGRNNLALALVAAKGPYGEKLNPHAVAQKHGKAGLEQAGRFLVTLFLQDDIPEAARAAIDRHIANAPGTAGGALPFLRQLTHGLVTLPEFQIA